MRWQRLLNIDTGDILSMIGLTRKRSEAESFFLGLGIGVAGGAIATLMLTPYTGTETREKIARASEDLGRTVQNKVNEVKTNLKNTSIGGATIGGTTETQNHTQYGQTPQGQGTRVGSV